MVQDTQVRRDEPTIEGDTQLPIWLPFRSSLPERKPHPGVEGGILPTPTRKGRAVWTGHHIGTGVPQKLKCHVDLGPDQGGNLR